ncbi:unnamed protein product [Gongylonema pulchrum]|uniref:ALOG domain-containing protein n=1 Tax=Gongylonema pulchrum TaxID=637853 RepID=A0A183EB12_9BILA|nr:unnamed protein product [Gongylonema pulchrum]
MYDFQYIDSLTDLSACIDKRLMCEKCWWTKDCCFKEKCKIRSWQRHFSTKRFVLKHYDELVEAFRALGWPMPQRKRKGDDGEMKFEPNHPSRPAGSMKKMNTN